MHRFSIRQRHLQGALSQAWNVQFWRYYSNECDTSNAKRSCLNSTVAG